MCNFDLHIQLITQAYTTGGGGGGGSQGFLTQSYICVSPHMIFSSNYKLFMEVSLAQFGEKSCGV